MLSTQLTVVVRAVFTLFWDFLIGLCFKTLKNMSTKIVKRLAFQLLGSFGAVVPGLLTIDTKTRLPES